MTVICPNSFQLPSAYTIEGNEADNGRRASGLKNQCPQNENPPKRHSFKCTNKYRLYFNQFRARLFGVFNPRILQVNILNYKRQSKSIGGGAHEKSPHQFINWRCCNDLKMLIMFLSWVV